MNATLAAAVALANGVPFDAVAAGLAAVEPGGGRMELLQAASGALVLDDAYNASPASMAAALQALASVRADGRRIAVLGEMRELGSQSDDEHAMVGRLAADARPRSAGRRRERRVAAGRGRARARTGRRDRGARRRQRARRARTAGVGAGDAVLVKGSRAVGLELVVRALTEQRPFRHGAAR